MNRHHGKIDLHITVVEGLHHGGQKAGNTSLLRREEFVNPKTLERCFVPFVSGASLKHRLRESGVRYAWELMGSPKVSKAIIQLLFAGGALTKKSGAIPLQDIRRVSELFPILSVCGYSSGNHMEESKVRCSKLHLVCAENLWRMPEHLHGTEHAKKTSGAFVGDNFGVRSEPTNRVSNRALLLDGEISDEPPNQMIFDEEVLLPGSVLWGEVSYRGLSSLEMAAFVSAWKTASTGQSIDEKPLYLLGGNTNRGQGVVAMAMTGTDLGLDLTSYVEHLLSHRDEILELLERMAP